MSWPNLPPSAWSNPCSYVVSSDLAELPRELLARHLAELLQWRARDGLSPTALAICAVLGLYRGLRGGRDGCGVQAPAHAWARLLGVSTRMVGYAFAELAAAGLAWRRPRLAKVSWVDSAGVPRSHADVHAVAYLSPLGAVRLSRRNEAGPQRGTTRRLVVIGGAERRVLVATGLLGTLLRTMREQLRLLARRVAAVPERFRPTAGKRRRSLPNEPEAPQPSPRGSCPGTDPPQALGEGDDLERQRLTRLWRAGQLTPATAWPALWSPIPSTGRTRRHWWLIRRCELLVRELSAAALAPLAAQLRS